MISGFVYEDSFSESRIESCDLCNTPMVYCCDSEGHQFRCESCDLIVIYYLNQKNVEQYLRLCGSLVVVFENWEFEQWMQERNANT